MTKRIILHCGLGKTGTSALQVKFAQGREVMIEKLGLDYIKAGAFDDQVKGKISSGNGVQFAKSYLPVRNPSSLLHRQDEITTEILYAIQNTPHDVLLSSEFFSALPVPDLAKLVGVLRREGAVELVYFVRNQASLFASVYMQKVKRHGETGLPAASIDHWIKQRHQSFYYKRFIKLRDALPNVPTHIRMYESSRDHLQGVLGLFLETVGFDPGLDLGVEDIPVNTSPSPLELRLMLEINRFNPRMQFSDMLVEASAEAGRSRFHSEHSILSPETLQKIKETYDAENEAFFKEFFGTENQYDIDTEVDYVDLGTLVFEPHEVVSIIGGLMTKMDRRIAALEAAEQDRRK
ncbi:MAG: hypothetical protein AAFQ05_04010 [Pseudomonadota bacterium]